MPVLGWLGRVKTLHPGVHGGILARRDLPAHLDALQQQGISLIDLASSPFSIALHSHYTALQRLSAHICSPPCIQVVLLTLRDDTCHSRLWRKQHLCPRWTQVIVNLYPFRQTVTATQAPSYEDAVENIDIGGPAMIRAAAKNHAHVRTWCPCLSPCFRCRCRSSHTDSGHEHRRMQ